MSAEYKLTLTKPVLEEYYKYYFSLHKKARKKPIEHPYHPSINVWFIMARPQMNALKQKWKDFCIWWIDSLGYNNLNLQKFEMKFKTFMPTKRRIDPDNTVPKFILDGFSESGFIVDDDGNHLLSLILQTGYDKKNPRTEITVRVLEEKEGEII
nr:MAG TPA: Endodeoxyribonuclease RusA [Caudoviricetes sp.]